MRTVRIALVLAAVSCGAPVVPSRPGRAARARIEAEPVAAQETAPAPPAAAVPVLPDRMPRPDVRVTLTRTVASGRARVVVKGGWTLTGADGATVRTGTSLDAELRLDATAATLAGAPVPAHAELRPAADDDLNVEGRTYPGTLVVERGPDGRWTAAVATDVETYVAAVVTSEVPATFPREAQRAQAMIARTYALASTVRTSRDAPLVLTDVGGIDQEFSGLAVSGAQRRAALDAARSTSGLVLTEDGVPIVAYYHSTCGGATCPGTVVFGQTGAARALSGGIVCTWCSGSRYFRWTARIPGADVVKAAALTGTLEGFATAERTAGGRAASFDVTAGGKTRRVRAAEFRLRVGPSAMRSTMLDDAVITGGELALSGRGWGHGVGLCQVGARTLAEKGLTAEAIVARYYPGAVLEQRW
jgi:stage II sporulation protein D (peptidoglycan lytic transglycosylase)